MKGDAMSATTTAKNKVTICGRFAWADFTDEQRRALLPASYSSKVTGANWDGLTPACREAINQRLSELGGRAWVELDGFVSPTVKRWVVMVDGEQRGPVSSDLSDVLGELCRVVGELAEKL